MPNLQADSTSVLIIGGLALLIVAIAAIGVLWFRSRQPHDEPPTSLASQPASAEPEAAVIPLPPPVPAEPMLEFTDATGQPVNFKLDKPALTVGRAPDNDLVIPETIPNSATVSKHHARLRRDQDDYIVRDLGSKNGLTVNGRQTVENLLQDGDHLSFGTVEAIFHQPPSNGSSAYTGESGSGGAA